MKRFDTFLLLMMVFPLMSMMACSDDDSAPGDANVLVGTWNVDLIQVSGSIGGIGISETVTPTGTITFNSDFTGKENYSYNVPGIGNITENDNFTWRSSAATITFDPGDVDESVWTREINEQNRQRGKYTESETGEGLAITITISK